jgi:hypothetical protein
MLKKRSRGHGGWEEREEALGVRGFMANKQTKRGIFYFFNKIIKNNYPLIDMDLFLG